MDIVTTPDIYVPFVDAEGNYVDKMPMIKNGLYCPCGSRKDKIYENPSKFSSHTKTKVHQKWLESLNHNKANYYAEMLKYKEINENQRKIIAHLEHEIQKKILTIDCLTEQWMNHPGGSKPNHHHHHEAMDLLDL